MNLIYRYLLLGVAGLLTLPSCMSFKHPDFAAELSRARTDCTGTEIAGMWVTSWSNLPFNSGQWRNSMLLRPDGTGKLRGQNAAMNPAGTEWSVRWTYAGQGVWRIIVQGIERSGAPDFGLTQFGPRAARWTGTKLLTQGANSNLLVVTSSFDEVWIRADDEAAVAEHLQTH